MQQVQPRRTEGLGFGHISMPGAAPDTSDPESRYRVFRKQSHPQSRHSPSHSDPSTLAPFVASLASSTSALPVPPPSTHVPHRKFSLQTIPGDGFPMIVSRTDFVPTFTPAELAPIPPTPDPQEKDKDEEPKGEKQRKGSKSRPPPIKISSSSHGAFLGPLLKGLGGKDGKEEDKDKEVKEAKERSAKGRTGKKGKTDSIMVDPHLNLLENQAAFLEHYPDAVPRLPGRADDPFVETAIAGLPRTRNDSGYASSGSLLPPTSVPSPGTSQRVPVPSIAESPAPFALKTTSVAAPGRQPHRRTNSDNNAGPSPERDEAIKRPSLSSSKSASTLANGSSSSRPHTSYIPSTVASATRRTRNPSKTTPPATPTNALAPPFTQSTSPFKTSNTLPLVTVAVQGAASLSSKIPLTPDGVSVTLSSTARPEDVEVSWTCTTTLDESTGLPHTKWTMSLRPRASVALPLTPPATAKPSTIPFSGYRMSTLPSPTAPSHPTSPRSTPPPSFAPPPPPPIPSAMASRKPSASELSGSSFSSESGAGPHTPRRTRFSSVDSERSSTSVAPSAHRKMGHSTSYNSVAEQYRLRQLSLEEELQVFIRGDDDDDDEDDLAPRMMIEEDPKTPTRASRRSSEESQADEEEERRMAAARGKMGRMMSKWSDTEGEESDEEGPGRTSWDDEKSAEA